MNIVIYSNCAGNVIKEMFDRHNYTKDKFIVQHIANYEHLDKTMEMSHISMLNNCDVFIYQPFNKNYTHSEYNISNLLKYLKDKCKILKVNYYRFKGFWFESELKPYDRYGTYIFNDSVYYGIHNSFENFNGSYDDVVSKIDSLTLDKGRFDEYFQGELYKLKVIDDNSDVKLYDYFMNNYKYKPLFHDIFHPTNLFFYEIFRQVIFKITGENLVAEDTKFLNACDDIEMTHWALPILPWVKRHLDIRTPEVICVFFVPMCGEKIYMNIYDYYFIRLTTINFQHFLNSLQGNDRYLCA